MGITREAALRILELHRDATNNEIRASYKRLALKWHPDKHGNSPEATERFQEVSSAYKRLTSNDGTDEIQLSKADMFNIFADVFFHRNGVFDYSRYSAFESDEDISDENDIEDELLHNIAARLKSKYDRSKSNTNYTKTNGKPAHNLSEAEANKNAEELIKEEERERKKAEKRRQKKKRNKEKKKQKEQEKDKKDEEKENKKVHDKEKPTNKAMPVQNEKINLKENQNMSNKPTVKSKSVPNGVKEKDKTQNHQNKKDQKSKDSKKSQVNGDTDSSEDDPDWDQSSAFFARAAGRGGPSNATSNTSPPTQTTTKTNTQSTTTSAATSPTNNKTQQETETSTDQLDPVVLKSRQLAVRGNEMANQGNYTAAIELFSEAIKMDARDFRFFGNRSYCFDRLGQYEKALQDADIAISLAPDWPKGYFRRGRALAGIKLFADSEVAFAQVLKLDKNCEDAMFELARVRVQQLEEMGFSNLQSEAAIHQYGTVQSALEALLAGKVNCPNPEDIYVSDGEDDNTPQSTIQNIHQPTAMENKHCKSIWVGNVNSEVLTEQVLQKLFSRCGQIESVKLLPSKYCAFINYYTGDSAARAIETLQGYEIGGQNLLLRYPNNSGLPTTLQPQVSESLQKAKLTGPVNGDECYFWRTTGCCFGDKCRNRHVPESKGIDLKKVEAKYGVKL